MEQKRYLVNDLVVMEDVCNANCSYCITAGSNLKAKHNLKFWEDKLDFHLNKLLDDENSYQEGKQLKERLDRVADIMKRRTDPLILKISGGEILLVKGIDRFMEQQAPLYRRIQVLTNGILLNRDLLKCFSKIPNLSLQISMDGHTPEANKYRIKSEAIQRKLCQILDLCNEYEIKLEINCVLTDGNMDKLFAFAVYLNNYDNVLLQPYPVRGKYRDRFFPKQEQLSSLDRLIKEHDNFIKILPPKRYLQELEDFLRTGVRKNGCIIPNLIYQSFDDGMVSPCPNIWYKSVGNVLVQEDETIEKLHCDLFYQLINRKQSVLEQCRHCFTPWDIINLFVRGEITESEICGIYLYNDPEILEYLRSAARIFGTRGR